MYCNTNHFSAYLIPPPPLLLILCTIFLPFCLMMLIKNVIALHSGGKINKIKNFSFKFLFFLVNKDLILALLHKIILKCLGN
jgi:hypothetical protein